MKPFQLKQHLEKLNPGQNHKNLAFFKTKAEALKRYRLYDSGNLQQASMAATQASSTAAKHVAENKKIHTIGKTLIKPCMLDCEKLVLSEYAVNKRLM